MRRRQTLRALLLVVAAPLTARAQVLRTSSPALDSLAIGARVRVTLNSGPRLQGTILTRDSLTLVLLRPPHTRRPHAPDSTWTVSRDSLQAAWLDAGGHASSGLRRGALIGAIVGAVGGCVLGFVPEDHACPGLTPVGLVIGAAIGGGVGAGVGSGIRVWVPVRL